MYKQECGAHGIGVGSVQGRVEDAMGPHFCREVGFKGLSHVVGTSVKYSWLDPRVPSPTLAPSCL